MCRDGGNGIRVVACQLLCNFAAALDGTLTLLKSQIIPEVSKALQTALVRHDDALADRCLKIFSAVTSHSAGQRQLMRVQGLPPFLEIAADLPMQRMPLTGASLLLLLRNLAFLSDNKAYFLADPRQVFCPPLSLCSTRWYCGHGYRAGGLVNTRSLDALLLRPFCPLSV